MIRLHYNIQIFGRVQGVGFRYSSLEQARNFQLFGFAKNLYDGSVYIEVEGTEDLLELFVEWCRNGPDRAKVRKIEITKSELKDYTSFDVK